MGAQKGASLEEIMPPASERTAYYLNHKLPRLALIGDGIELPAGEWIWIADELIAPWQAEQLAREQFPALRGSPLPFIALLTDYDVLEFERELAAGLA